MSRRVGLCMLLIGVPAFGGCGGSETTTEKVVLYVGPAPASVTKHIVVRKFPHLGRVLVDGKGFPVYAFVPDKAGITCIGACLGMWPLYRLLPANALDTSPSLSEALLSIGHAREGGRTVSYSNWLLHTYSGDRTSDIPAGQAVNDYGGHWYLISPKGNLVVQPTEAPAGAPRQPTDAHSSGLASNPRMRHPSRSCCTSSAPAGRPDAATNTRP